MELTDSNIRYLLCIYKLLQKDEVVSSVDIAKDLNVTKCSVSKMLGFLQQKKLINKKKYGKITLSDDGIVVAKKYYSKHLELLNLLSDNFDLSIPRCEHISGKILIDLFEDDIEVIN